MAEDKDEPLYRNRLQSHKSMGQKTQEQLKKKGIKSPSTNNLVHVKGRTSLVPKEDVSTPEKLEAWRQKKIELLGL